MSVRSFGISAGLSSAALLTSILALKRSFSGPRSDSLLAYLQYRLAQGFENFYSFDYCGLFLAVAALTCLCASITSIYHPRLQLLPYGVLAALAPTLIVLDAVDGGWGWALWPGATGIAAAVSLYFAVVMATMSDYVFLVVVRRLLRLQSDAHDLRFGAGPTVAIISLTIVFVIAPLVVINQVPPGDLRYSVFMGERWHVPSWQDYWATYIAAGAYGWLVSDVYDVIVGMFVPVTIVLLVLNWIAWRSLERPLYTLQRFGIFRHRKALAGIGAGLIGFGLPPVGKVLGWLVALF